MICGVHSGQVGLDQVRYNRVYSLEVAAEHNLSWCIEFVLLEFYMSLIFVCGSVCSEGNFTDIGYQTKINGASSGY